jgi:hypothetical protein
MIPQRTLGALALVAFVSCLVHAQTGETFGKARLTMQVGDKTRAVDVSVNYEPTAMVIVDRNTGQALRTLPYTDMKGGEYSFAKSPRWKTAILVSPLFLFTSGQKHWLLAQGQTEYALLHLDKSNYRMVIASFETRTGKKVEAVGDNK